MTLRKMLLFASMARAVVVFAAPAASAAQWYTSGEPDVALSGEEEAHTVEGSGELSSEAGFQHGPFETHLEGDLWNTGGVGAGQINTAEITTPAPTSLPGCTIITASTNASHATPWPVSLGAGGAVTIGSATDPMTFTLHYSSFCTATYGVPTFIPIAGILTGQVVGECIAFNKSGDLRVEAPSPNNIAFNFTGEICLPEITGY